MFYCHLLMSSWEIQTYKLEDYLIAEFGHLSADRSSSRQITSTVLQFLRAWTFSRRMPGIWWIRLLCRTGLCFGQWYWRTCSGKCDPSNCSQSWKWYGSENRLSAFLSLLYIQLHLNVTPQQLCRFMIESTVVKNLTAALVVLLLA